MKLKYPNEQEVTFLKAFAAKINNKDYLFYVTVSNNGNDTVVFGELQGTNFVPVSPTDGEVVKGFLVDVNNSTALNNLNYTITNPNLDTVTVTGGSSTMLLTTSVDLLTNVNQKEEVVSFAEPVIEESKVEEVVPVVSSEVPNNNAVVTEPTTEAKTTEVTTTEGSAAVVTAEAPKTVVEEKPKKKKGKVLKLLLSLIILAALIAGAVWLVLTYTKDKKPKVVAEEPTAERKSLECMANPVVEVEEIPFTVTTDLSLQFDVENNIDVLIERERRVFDNVEEFDKYKADNPEEKPDATLGVDIDYLWSRDSKNAVKTTVYMKNHTKEEIWNEKTQGITTIESAKTVLTERDYTC